MRGRVSQSDRFKRFLQERTTLRVCLVVLLVAGSGVGLLYFASSPTFWVGRQAAQAVVQALGSLLIATVAIGLLWQLVIRRSFLDEILSHVKTAEEVRAAGIVGFTDAFYGDPDWASLFRSVNKLDIFFAYGRTWRNAHKQELEEVARRSGARIRVVLPDPNDDTTVSQLARRFDKEVTELKSSIEEAKADFLRLRSLSATTGAKTDIWLLSNPPLFTFYRFDNAIILTLYTHRHERTAVPTFLAESGGRLSNFINNEFDAMIREPNGLARRIT